MLPLGHAALGYLLYAGYVCASTDRLPLRYTIVPLAIGTQLPDLVDKPLAYLDMLTYGRSLAHSVFFMAAATVLVWQATIRLNERFEPGWRAAVCQGTPLAFAIGYAGHLVGDAYGAVVAGDPSQSRFLLYPLYIIPESAADETAPWIRLIETYQTMSTHPQLELILLAASVFTVARIRQYRTGMPHS
jgi:hypothetical protein